MDGRWWRRVGAVITAALCFTLCGSTPLASAASFRATSGSETATIRFSGRFPMYRDVTLVVRRGDEVADQQLVRSKWCGGACGPSIYPSPATVIRFVRLGRSATPDLVLSLYSGGAHCCTIEQVYSPQPDSRPWKVVEYDFGDPGVRLIPSGSVGDDDFLSANDAFAYKFTDFAASGMPILIMSFYDGAFHDVTRKFPRLIAHDAEQWSRAFRADAPSHYHDTVGVVAAWVADEDMLGQSKSAEAFLRREAAAGHLNSALGSFEPQNERFVRVLQTFLRQQGYQGAPTN